MTTQTNPLLEAALGYAARGWHVFPCHTPAQTGCSCRRETCKNIGKHPRTKNGLSDATTDEARIRRWWQMWPHANVAIRTGAVSGLVVLDRDDYKGGTAALQELERTYSPLPETVLGLTGGGGQHYGFAHPGTPVKNGVETLGPGLDIRADGGYVIAPPSLHESGKHYAWEVLHEPDDTLLAPMPAWLQALCQETKAREAVDAGAPIVDGQRNATLFQMGCSFRAKGCTEAVILAALREMNATQCQPPLTDAEVQKIVGSIAKYEAGPRAPDLHQRRNGDTPGPAFDLAAFLAALQSTPAADRLQTVLAAIDGLATVPLVDWVATKRTLKTEVPDLNLNDLERLRTEARENAQQRERRATMATMPDWHKALFGKKDGELEETDNNLQAIFANHPFWQGRLWLDVVAGRAYLDDAQPLDIHYVRNDVSPWLGTTMRMPIRHSGRVLEVMRSWAHRRPRDPIQEWLQALPAQDDTDLKRELLDTWLHLHAGAEDTPYTRFVSRILLVSLVQRAMDPGIQYRYVVVLEGEENVGKTQLLRGLGGRWHMEFPKSVEGKEAYMQLQGYWLVELGELDALKPAQESRIKMFISQQMDVWVPKYENDPTERPRRAILVGTTNEREYLKGQHGDTRYFPLWLDGPIYLAAITKVRDRLFTQAKHFLADHPDDWWCIPDDVEEELKQARKLRQEPSMFDDKLAPFCAARKKATVAEALEYLLIPVAQWSKRLEMDVGKAFKTNGWYRHVEWDVHTKKTVRFWAEEPQKKQEVPF